jgi:hypothetical protein
MAGPTPCTPCTASCLCADAGAASTEGPAPVTADSITDATSAGAATAQPGATAQQVMPPDTAAAASSPSSPGVNPAAEPLPKQGEALGDVTMLQPAVGEALATDIQQPQAAEEEQQQRQQPVEQEPADQQQVEPSQEQQQQPVAKQQPAESAQQLPEQPAEMGEEVPPKGPGMADTGAAKSAHEAAATDMQGQAVSTAVPPVGAHDQVGGAVIPGSSGSGALWPVLVVVAAACAVLGAAFVVKAHFTGLTQTAPPGARSGIAYTALADGSAAPPPARGLLGGATAAAAAALGAARGGGSGGGRRSRGGGGGSLRSWDSWDEADGWDAAAWDAAERGQRAQRGGGAGPGPRPHGLPPAGGAREGRKA